MALMATSVMAKLRVKSPGSPLSTRSTHSERSNHSRRSIRSTIFNRENKYVVQAKTTRPKKRIGLRSILTILRRLVVISAAIQYIYISMAATWRTMDVLRSVHSPPETFAIYTTSLIAGYAGEGLIRDSPLVRNVLGGDTTPRHYALFLESETKTSTENCSSVPLFNADIYNAGFLGHGYEEMVNDTQYNITDLAEFELVLVVVDCTFPPLQAGDPSMVRVFNLVRSRSDPSDLYLVSVSMSVQNYEIPAHGKRGPGLLAMLAVVHDMGEGTVDQYYLMAPTYPYQRSLEFEVYEFVGISESSYLELRSIPHNPLTQHVKSLSAARQRGFFDLDSQSNIAYTHSLLNAVDAKSALTEWVWSGEAVISDSWAWVHGIHFFFGMQTVFALAVLLIVAYQNLRLGKLWIGAPFAAVSTTTVVMRGVLVVISWILNSFWTLFEFCLSNGGILSGTQTVRIHKELVHADVLVVYLGLVGILSIVLRERIDPSVAIFLFEIIHKHRLSVIRATPAVLEEVETYSDSVFGLGVVKPGPDVADMSPLRLWTALQIPSKDAEFLAASFFPKITLLGIIMGFALFRKVYRYFSPEQARQRSNQSRGQSTNENAALSLKGNLTNFEIATGAELQSRFGLISDYNNYVYFKGMKFASADGVYCSGHVIANGKFLVGTKDLLAIVLIKAVRSRFTNVYVYEVEGNTVKDTARLVYPHMFTWADLWRINVSVLL